MSPIRIRGSGPDGAEAPVDESPNAYIIIRMMQHLGHAEQEDLNSKGVKLLSLIDAQTYLCKYGQPDLGPIRQLPYVDAAVAYQSHVRIHHGLRAESRIEEVPLAVSANLGGESVNTVPDGDEHDKVIISLHDQHSELGEDLVARLAKAGLINPDETEVNGRRLETTVQKGSIQQIAGEDSVRSIEAYRDD
ncbi:hypothetical protein EDB81DRAFT_858108 [Dactylonectria macrodidyma]|uniref:Uncharacterized protein n=1 Tax=Dactylonectria macrodidyma TaxID=307937 RepID=A0A9P9EPY5_9HYPO|nr:hypothetical protein EDB81DRAFT_858108 [Dactylonectria macrodidyma]